MSTSHVIVIDQNEQFPHLNSAPIVEAVVDLRARAESDWNESVVTDFIKTRLPDYPKRLSMSGFQQEFVLGPDAAPQATRTDTGWTGLHCQTEDKLHVARFERNGFIFSRLRPYDRWEQLVAEAMRLWEIFVDVARPSQIPRIGLRFVNRIDLPSTAVRIDDYLDPAPQGVRGLDIPFQHFLHQDVFDVAGHPYAVRLVRTTQPAPGPDPQSFGIIIDIDVFTTRPSEPSRESIESRLNEMRWLKNKMFFGSITSKALETFR